MQIHHLFGTTDHDRPVLGSIALEITFTCRRRDLKESPPLTDTPPAVYPFSTVPKNTLSCDVPNHVSVGIFVRFAQTTADIGRE